MANPIPNIPKPLIREMHNTNRNNSRADAAKLNTVRTLISSYNSANSFVGEQSYNREIKELKYGAVVCGVGTIILLFIAKITFKNFYNSIELKQKVCGHWHKDFSGGYFMGFLGASLGSLIAGISSIAMTIMKADKISYEDFVAKKRRALVSYVRNEDNQINQLLTRAHNYLKSRIGSLESPLNTIEGEAPIPTDTPEKIERYNIYINSVHSTHNSLRTLVS